MKLATVRAFAMLAISVAFPVNAQPVNGETIVPGVVRSAVQGKLRDPASAQYRNVWIHALPKGAVVCGEVNAKNGFGGYSGFARFFVLGDLAMVDGGGGANATLDAVIKGQFENAYRQFCEAYPAVREVRL